MKHIYTIIKCLNNILQYCVQLTNKKDGYKPILRYSLYFPFIGKIPLIFLFMAYP